MAHIYLVVFRFPNLFTESVRGKSAAVYKTCEKGAKNMHVIQQKMEINKIMISWPSSRQPGLRIMK